jgi:hypothetical protein
MEKSDLEDIIKSLSTDGIGSSRRTVTFYTGARGAELFNHEFEVRNAVDKLGWLIEKKRITKEQAHNLENMLTSPDWENFNLAIEFIKIFSDGTNISS